MPVVATIAPDTAPPAMAPPIPSLKGRPVQAFATTFETPPTIAPTAAPITPKSQNRLLYQLCLLGHSHNTKIRFCRKNLVQSEDNCPH